MTLSLMLYVFLVSGLLAGGAALVHSLVRSSLPGTRFIWALAMGASLALVLVAPARMRVAETPVALGEKTMTAEGAEVPLASSPSAARRVVDRVIEGVSSGLAAAPAWVSRALGATWFASSLVVLGLLALSYRRHRRRIAGAVRETMEGTAVRVTESLGPAVVGVWRPDIVVPRWLLSRPRAERSLVVRHERSHVDVGDPALLLGGCAIAALMPWNPATWYMLSRLRLAIEVDCDRRVLRAGAAPREYGALLIELTSALPATRIGAPAFACRPSHLERRLVAMTARPLTHRPVRLFAAAGVAALAMLGACQADLPTAAQVEEIDAVEVEGRLMPLLKLDQSAIIYEIDGKVVDRATVMAMSPEEIGSIEVTRRGVPRMMISTARAEGAAGAGAGDDRDQLTREALTQAERRLVESRAKAVAGEEAPFTGTLRRVDASGAVVPLYSVQLDKQPLLVLDGIVRSEAEFKAVRASEIESVEIVKGAAAQAKYGEVAKDGVIEVRLKQAQTEKRAVGTRVMLRDTKAPAAAKKP